MTSVSSSFPFDDAPTSGSRGPHAAYDRKNPSAGYPSPPMSPSQVLELPGAYMSSVQAWYDADQLARDEQSVSLQPAQAAPPAARARPVSYQPSPTMPSLAYLPQPAAAAPIGTFATGLSDLSKLTADEQLEYYSRMRANAAGEQGHPRRDDASASRKRASHQPPSAMERAVPRVRTIGEDHPAVVAFKQAHPRRAQLEFGSYILLQTLGEGEFGKVKLGVHKDFGEECAVKLIKKGNLGGDGDSRMLKVRREIEVLSHVKHPNVVRLYDLVETEKYIGIILGFADGGELFDHILAHRYLKEKDASKLFAQLISGVHYLHSKNIIHRDLKLENLLLDKARNVIITDFGFANSFDPSRDDLMATSCGSPCYAAPELVVAEGLYAGSAVDIWSCGVILYAMLSGYLPFDDDPANPEGDNINLLYRYILNTQLQFPSHISPLARDLLSVMLVPDPAHRATLKEIMEHPWLEQHWHLLNRSVEELEEVANQQHRIKRQQARRDMEERKALKERAAQQKQQTFEMARSQSARNGLMGTPEGAPSRVKAARHQSAMPSTSTTVPDFFAGGRDAGNASTPVNESSVSASDSRPRLNVGFPADATPSRSSWNVSDGQESSDFYLADAEGPARGEPRSRVGSLASGALLDRSNIDVTSSPTTSSRRKHHTIQVEYASTPAPADEDVVNAQPVQAPAPTRSRTSSSRSRPTSIISSSAPLTLSDPVLSAPTVTTINSVASPSAAASLLTPASPVAFKTAHDVNMSSPPKLSNSPDSGHSSVAETTLPTPAPSQHVARPSTPPNSKIPAPLDLMTTPKASLGQTVSPPDTPRGPALADITNGTSQAEASTNGSQPTAIAPAIETFTSAPVERSRSRLSTLLAPARASHGGGSAENVPVDIEKVKAEKKGKRNTLTLALKSTLDRRSSKKSTPTSGVFSNPTTTRLSKSSSRPASRMSAAPSNLSPRTPVLDGQFRAQQQTYRQPLAAAAVSTGPAKKVMDWFRRKSLKTTASSQASPGKTDSFVSVAAPSWTPPKSSRLSTDLSHAVAPAAVDPPTVSTSSPFAPSLVVTGTADNGPPSSTFSTAPSAFRAIDSLSSQRSAASARQAADAIAMPPPAVPASKQFNPASLRFHNGVLDKSTVTSGLPPVVLEQVIAVLQAMDVDIKREGEYRLKCTRSKRTRGTVGLGIANGGIVPSGSTMSGFSLMGLANSSQTDKRGLPMPSSPSSSFLSGSGLKGLMMRRSSSHASSHQLSPTMPQSPAALSIDDSASSTGHASEEAMSPTTMTSHSGVQAAQQDSGDEVRFSVEVTRIKNLPGLYSVDFKRIKGSAWNYKSIYQKAVDTCAFEDNAK